MCWPFCRLVSQPTVPLFSAATSGGLGAVTIGRLHMALELCRKDKKGVSGGLAFRFVFFCFSEQAEGAVGMREAWG